MTPRPAPMHYPFALKTTVGDLGPYLGRTCTGRVAPALPGAFHLFDHLVG
jgi:hypothetical protein